jgi:hypothetical protein
VRCEDLSDAEKAWVEDNERLWARAHAIAARHPGMDVSLVYHTLVNLRRTPEERLARGLVRVAPAAR